MAKKKYTLAMAKRDSLKKWRFLASRNFTSNDIAYSVLVNKHPELCDLSCLCGFCEYDHIHGNCPLTESGQCDCCIHEFMVWDIKPTKANALKVLKKIQAVKVK